MIIRLIHFSKWSDWRIYHVVMATVLLGLYTQPAVWNGGEEEKEGHQEKGYQGRHMQTGQMAEVRSEKGSAWNSSGLGGEPVWDQPQAKHQIQELGDEGVWGLSLYPGLSGKRASFPFLYSLFFPVLFTSLLAMNPWYEKSILQKWRNRRILCTLNIQYLLARGWEFLKGHA